MKTNPFMLMPIAALLLAGCDDQAPILDNQQSRPIRAIKLDEQNQYTFKQFAGVLTAENTANLAFKVPGTIEEILVKTGDTVTKGQPIARLDPHDYQVTVLELQARLEEAKAAHALAAIELKRVKQATQDNAIASVNLDRARTGYKRSAAMVKVVEQNLQKAKDALQYTTLIAPFDGIVAKRFSETFEQAVPGIPVFTVHQPALLQADIDVPESLMAKFDTDAVASVTWYGLQQNVPATLKETSTQPDPIKQTYTLSYRIDEQALSASQQLVLPGKAVKVNVTFKQPAGLYCIPYSAISLNQGGTPTVFTIDHDKAIPNPVIISAIQGQDVCVAGNLKAGDLVISAGIHYLTPNTKLDNVDILAEKHTIGTML
ncbi:efflux RND transporter periplasmic adaptor subunit [Photobacterium sanctipauli]|uniref:Efflux RND transporter periplasmic adaptor subunit n=2 Tax=Photobacterium sanctipauli TaxID=1342794 RepID=A0A2T3NU75_9GAMM|nr:efflux RND transporter periplasmic adaptor subunit [Photobacterium sanctipauli]PSW19812.1 efflux RND transporter periplasmic adaptor subunit [Photobacterium sanctipauli]